MTAIVRFPLAVIFSAGLGSILATLLVAGVEERRFDFGVAVITMFFSGPGAIMLVGLRAIPGAYRPSPIMIDSVTAVTGAIVGGLMLGVFAVQHDWGAMTGSFYGVMTALALILFDRLWRAISSRGRNSKTSS